MPRPRAPALLLALVCLAVLAVQGCARQAAAPGAQSAGPEQFLRVSRLQLVDLAKGIERAHVQQLVTAPTYQRLREAWQDVALRHQQLLDVWRLKGAYEDNDADALARAILLLSADLAVARGPSAAAAGGGES